MAMSVVYGTAFGGIISENRGGVVSAYVPDPLGNTIGLMNSAGTLTDSWTYWPYGEVRTRSGSNATPFTFIGTLGYFLDNVNKMCYIRARHLRLDLARWLTVDPMWPDQPEYVYCSDSPASKIDPSGLDECDLLLGACLVFVAAALFTCISAAAAAAAACAEACTVSVLLGLVAVAVCEAICVVAAAAARRWCVIEAAAGALGCYLAYMLCRGLLKKTGVSGQLF